MFTAAEVNEIRSHFPLARNKAYFNSCSKGALSFQVRDSVLEFLNAWNQFGAPWNLWLPKIEEARELFARLIGATEEEIAVTFCVSTGTNTVASSLEFNGSRNRIVMSADEFPTMAHIWLAQRRRGAQVQFVSPQQGQSLIEAFDRAIDKETLIVVAHQVHHRTGSYLDIAKLAKICHARGAYLFFDAYHSVGVIDLDVKSLDVDFLITGCMKYLLGSTGGTAFLYVRDELISTHEPLYTGWFSQRDIFTYFEDRLEYDDSARRFESGLQSVAGAYAALAGMQILEKIGIRKIEAHVSSLSRQFAEQVEGLGLEILAPMGHYGPMVALRSRDPERAIESLSERDVIVASWKDALRFSFHCYTSEEDILTTLNAIEECRELFY